MFVQDKLPDTGSGFEGEGGDINDAGTFVWQTFFIAFKVECLRLRV